MKRSRPTRLAALMEETLARLGLDRRLDDYRVWQAWDEVVGRTISRNAQPVRLDGPRLVVVVRSSTWLQELSLLQRELVARLNEWMGREVVRELFFVVGRVEVADQASARESAAPPAPRPVPRDGPGASEAPPPGPGMSPEVAAAFERLWKAARRRAR